MKHLLLFSVLLLPTIGVGCKTVPQEMVTPASTAEAHRVSALEARQRMALAARNVAPKFDPRTQDELDQDACLGADGVWHCQLKRVTKFKGSNGFSAFPSSWTVPNWVIDSANLSGCANDINNCTASSCTASGIGPCATYSQLVQRWGTKAPHLRQNTTLTWISSQSGTTDSVYFNPYIEAGAQVQITSPLTGGTTCSLSGVVSKNRAAHQPLQAVASCATALGQLVVNTTHPSRAWVDVVGSPVTFTQPYLAETVPYDFSPHEVDTWANGDSVTVYTLTAVNIAELRPVLSDYNTSSLANFMYVHNVNVLDPNGIAFGISYFSSLFVSTAVSFLESTSQRMVILEHDRPAFESAFFNNEFVGGILGGPTVPGSGSVDSLIEIIGGAATVGDSNGGGFASDGQMLSGVQLDGDVMMANAQQEPSTVTNSVFGYVYLGPHLTLNAGEATGVAFATTISSSSPGVVWGPGTFNVSGSNRFNWCTGGGCGTAPNTFLQTGLQIDGQTTACALDATGDPVLIHCGRSLTPFLLGASVGGGGFGGNAFVLGGGSIVNAGFGGG
jgi:hypothetical protein